MLSVLCVWVFEFVCVCMYVCVYVCMYVCRLLYMEVCIYASMYMSMYVYLYSVLLQLNCFLGLGLTVVGKIWDLRIKSSLGTILPIKQRWELCTFPFHLCTCSCSFIHSYIHTYIHTYIYQIDIHTYMHTYMHRCVSTLNRLSDALSTNHLRNYHKVNFTYAYIHTHTYLSAVTLLWQMPSWWRRAMLQCFICGKLLYTWYIHTYLHTYMYIGNLQKIHTYWKFQ